MLEINLKQLEAFVTTAEYSSFTKAAEALYLTQSTVSAHISALEEVLGVRLIQRGSRRRVQLTAEGKQAYDMAKEILNHCQSLQNLGTTLEQCQLVVGASSVPSQYLVPELMSGFLTENPDSRYVLQRGDSDRIHQLLKQGDARLGFVGSANDRENYNYHVISDDRLVLITPNTEHYRKLKSSGTSGRLLLKEPMILREVSSGTRKAMEAYLNRLGVPVRSLNLVAQIDNTEAIKSSVSRGIGVSVVSELTVREELESGKLLSFDLDSGGVYRNIYLTWRKDITLTGAEKKFVEYVQSQSDKV
ncbi:MAG: LysR family transcriptional regulator [Oscillospiraceae bacterium]|nr:LysR family transcriptional regulator [Oscillospiraceae bacterium]